MNARALSVALAALAGILSGCANGDPVGVEPIDDLPRQLTAIEQEIVANANTFGFDLFRRVYAPQPGPNVVLSPLSASMALGMALNGAQGDTWEAMRTGLRFGQLSQDDINRGYASLIALLAGLDERVVFRIGNSVWTRLGFPVLPSFYEVVSTYFEAEAQELDFDSEAAVEVINGWVRNATNGRIERAIEQISIADLMFLINAIYFDGQWTQQFDPDDTRADVFNRADGSRVDVEMMSREVEAPYATGPDYQAIELRYGGGAFGMVVVLPSQGVELGDFLARVDDAWWGELTERLQPAEIPLSMPKMTVRFDAYLNDPLGAMGMDVAFSPLADFSNLTPEPVCIQYVRQKTFLEIDEEGTEAAAVTVVSVGVTSAPLPMRVDRPFLFAIRERFSGTILFLGAIGDPSEDEAPAVIKPDPPC